MNKVQVPQGYQQVMPYLILNDANGFLQFVTEVFEAKEKMLMHRDDKSIMHGEVFIGDSVIMFAQATSEFPAGPGASFFIYVADVDKTFQDVLNRGGTAVQKVDDKDYGRSGGATDPFGNTWWITSAKQ